MLLRFKYKNTVKNQRIVCGTLISESYYFLIVQRMRLLWHCFLFWIIQNAATGIQFV